MQQLLHVCGDSQASRTPLRRLTVTPSLVWNLCKRWMDDLTAPTDSHNERKGETCSHLVRCYTELIRGHVGRHERHVTHLFVSFSLSPLPSIPPFSRIAERGFPHVHIDRFARETFDRFRLATPYRFHIRPKRGEAGSYVLDGKCNTHTIRTLSSGMGAD